MNGKMRKAITLAITLVMIYFSVLLVASAVYTIGAFEDRQISGARMYSTMLDLCNIAGRGIDSGIRMNNKAAEAAAYILKAFEKVGLKNVRLESFEALRWWPTYWEVTVLGQDGNVALESFPFWYTSGTMDEGIEAELVYVGYGTIGEFDQLDVKGKVVLIDMKRFLHFRESHRFTGAYETAVKKGARAVILADTLIDSPSGRFLGLPNQFGPIPCLSIGKSSGEYLKGLLKQGGQVKVRVRLNIEISSWTGYNVVGELPGNGKVDEIILVGGHYDTWFTGANDNLAGVSGIIELARYYASKPQSSRNRNMMFVALFGHEFRDFGHRAFIQQHSDIINKITVFMNCDHWGAKGYEEIDGEIRETGYVDKLGIFTSNPFLLSCAREVVVKYNLLPTFYWQGEILADMREFYMKGVPVFGIGGVHPYYHTPLDTPEKVSPKIMEKQAKAYRDIIDWVDDTLEGFIISTDENPYREAPNEPPREAYFVVIPTTPIVGSPVWVYLGFAYDDHVVLSYDITWDFGDGSTAVGPIAYHVYTKPGNYTITMKVTDIHGASTTASKEIEVKP